MIEKEESASSNVHELKVVELSRVHSGENLAILAVPGPKVSTRPMPFFVAQRPYVCPLTT